MRITKFWKICPSALLAIAAIIVVILYPYQSQAIPEWKLQVVDQSGQPIPNVTAHQEWINPVEDGITKADSRDTDLDGRVVFPRHLTRNRLTFRFAGSLPRAHIFVRLQDQIGDVFWEVGGGEPVSRLVLKPGGCPYG